MNKKIVLSLIMLLIMCAINTTCVYADQSEGVEAIISNMSDASTPDGADSGIAGSINDVIGMLQIAGTGIALIVVTMLGIKYMLAAPSEKANVKQQIMPILIGCILVFGAITIVSAITDFSAVIDSSAGASGS